MDEVHLEWSSLGHDSVEGMKESVRRFLMRFRFIFPRHDDKSPMNEDDPTTSLSQLQGKGLYYYGSIVDDAGVTALLS